MFPANLIQSYKEDEAMAIPNAHKKVLLTLFLEETTIIFVNLLQYEIDTILQNKYQII